MRRAAALLVILLIAGAFFTGCAKKQPDTKEPLKGRTGNYTTTAKIGYRDLQATARISQESPSSCAVTFESPESLEDMGFIFREDSVDLSYKGLSVTFEPDTLPGGAVAKMAVTAINKAMKDDGLTVAMTDGALEIRGMMESGEFILTINKETGNLMKLSVPAEELEIEFANFKFLD